MECGGSPPPWIAQARLRGGKPPQSRAAASCRTPFRSERNSYAEPGRRRRRSQHRLEVIRIDRRGRRVVRFFEAPALIEQDRALRVEDVEDVEQQVHLES